MAMTDQPFYVDDGLDEYRVKAAQQAADKAREEQERGENQG